MNKEVSWDHISKVIDAGRMAPSAGNLQNWKFIVVMDEGRRNRMAEACLQQYWMNQAPVHIVVVAEPKIAERYYGTRGDRLYSVQNCAAAVQNMLLRAHSLRLGSCWVGAFDEKMVAKTIGLPSEARAQAVVTLGYPVDKVQEPAKYPIENVAYFEKWRGKLRNVPAYMKMYSLLWKQQAHKAKKKVEKGSEKLAVKAKDVALKIKKRIEDKKKRYTDIRKFKKVHGLKK